MTEEEGRSLASQWDSPFFETSAALRQYVDDAFHGIIREIRRREREALAAKQKRLKKNQRHGIRAFFRNVVFRKTS